MQGLMRLWAVAFMLLPLPAFAQDATILDLYRELQIAQPNAVPPYEITPDARGKNAVRILLPSAPTARIEAEYDAQLDFLRITRREEGEGKDEKRARPISDVLEMALWLDAEGAPLLGLSERRLRENVPVAGRLRFFSRASGRWNVVTADVAPALSSAICGKPEGVVDDEAAEATQPVAAYLPLQDTRISIWCLPPGASARRGITLDWNAGQGVFERGGLSDAPAPWLKVQP